MTQPINDKRAERDRVAAALIETVDSLVKTLQPLDEKQRTTVAALVAASQAICAYGRSANRPDASIAEKFDASLGRLGPTATRIVKVIGWSRGCFDASIAYASGMASCEKSGKTHDQCEIENASAAAAELGCMFQALSKLIDEINKVIHGLPGTGPGPRPGPIR